MLDNLFTVAMLIAVTIAVASVIILIVGRAERPGHGRARAGDDRVGVDRGRMSDA